MHCRPFWDKRVSVLDFVACFAITANCVALLYFNDKDFVEPPITSALAKVPLPFGCSFAENKPNPVRLRLQIAHKQTAQPTGHRLHCALSAGVTGSATRLLLRVCECDRDRANAARVRHHPHRKPIQGLVRATAACRRLT
jgi:hypothetical protein